MSDELSDEYEFCYTKANRNRFAGAIKSGGKLVVLDPEIAAAFSGSEAVNTALRSLLAGLEKTENPTSPTTPA